MNNLEYRMYGLVPYNISPIQQGIQHGHGVVRYGRKAEKESMEEKALYDNWADNWETFIVLNGGTTNESKFSPGTMQVNAESLRANGIFTAEFREPDLNGTLTAVVFLVDERVFNKEKYPDFVAPIFATIPFESVYNRWVESVGGPQNAWLRSFLAPLRKA